MMLNNTKNHLSVAAKNIIFNIVLGLAFVISSIRFIEKSKMYMLIGGFASLIVGILMLWEVLNQWRDNENQDEMFRNHMQSAKAKTLDLVIGGLFFYAWLAGIMDTFTNQSIPSSNWGVLAFLIVGFSKIVTGLHFIYLERHGESD